MYQSKLFSKTRKEAPKDEVSKNAELLIKAGFINKEMAGVYSYLPLGLRVLNNIIEIIREEMNALGSQEIFLTSLQERDNWEKTNRWNDEVVDNWFKTKLKNETELGLAFTHEEALTNLMKNHVSSYKDLPFSAYQIQTKFRNEARAKSGIMRCREFLMKDMYSFSRDEQEHLAFYEKARQAYTNVFKRVGLEEKTHLTFASGGSFSKYSHEFQTESEAGEDLIYYSAKNNIAINKEVLTDEVLKDLHLEQKDLQELKAVEVGNIFTLGVKFSEPLGLTYVTESGERKPVFMGSYGIGPGRLMGTVVESLADEKGIVWPVSIAPFKVHLVEIGNSEEVKKASQDLYQLLQTEGIEVLYDDRDLRPGEKFADSDLLGIPLRVIVSEKTLISGEYEIKERAGGKVQMIKEIEVSNFVKKYV
jgi:prolyl-tRNA synthetase